MGVSRNGSTPKSCILIGFSIINHPFGGTPIYENLHMLVDITINWGNSVLNQPGGRRTLESTADPELFYEAHWDGSVTLTHLVARQMTGAAQQSGLFLSRISASLLQIMLNYVV